MGREPKRPEPVRGVELRARRRKDGTIYSWEYRVRWTDPATGRRLVEVCDTAQEARDFKASLRLLKRRGAIADLDRGRQSLESFAQEWLRDWAAINLPNRTLASYSVIYNRHVLPRVGSLQLRQITPKVVDQLKQSLLDDGVGAPTVRKGLAILQSMLRQAVVWGHLDINPVAAIKKPPARRRKVVVPLTVDQIETILQHIRRHARAGDAMLAELIGYSGARPQDALALPWMHVGQARLLYADKNVDGVVLEGAKTGAGKSRSVNLLQHLRQDLAAYRKNGGRLTGRALVVARPDGEPWRDHDYKNWHRRVFTPAATAAGVPEATPYYLRHTYASLRLAEQRLSLQEIADEMGHSIQVLSDTYAHVIAEYAGQGPIEPDRLIAAARRKLGSNQGRPDQS